LIDRDLRTAQPEKIPKFHIRMDLRYFFVYF